MPVCIGCGGSYDSNFRFCPFCGRAKPEPETVKIQLVFPQLINGKPARLRLRLVKLRV